MPTYQFFNLPDAGEGLTEAEIIEWRVAVGDVISINQILVEVGQPIIEVDIDPDGKAPAEPAPAAGEAAPAATREPNLVGYGAATEKTQRRRRYRPGIAETPQAPAEVAAPVVAAKEPVQVPIERILAKPPVRKLAKDLGIALADVFASGPDGQVTREDVLSVMGGGSGSQGASASRKESATPQELAAAMPSPRTQPFAGQLKSDERTTRVAIRSVRKRTAEAMVSSAFTAPHVTVFDTVDVTKTMRLIEELRADREWRDVKISPLLVVAKALLVAIRRNPEINASWDEAAQELVYKHYVNLGIAAATPRGLIVPNVKDAHLLNLRELSGEIADLTVTARAGKTSPSQLSDGTITITNVGVFGIDSGTPILVPGEAAILAVGAIEEKPWVHKGKIKKRYVTQLALSFDHRLVDGALGATVLKDVSRVMENPALGLVWG